VDQEEGRDVVRDDALDSDRSSAAKGDITRQKMWRNGLGGGSIGMLVVAAANFTAPMIAISSVVIAISLAIALLFVQSHIARGQVSQK
jgi:hypothetical protein